ncbi:MAG: type II secretion system protein [Deltaproteobacteria bacterium]
MNRRGYTLIELMITVSLIGIASASLFANFGSYQRETTRAMNREALGRVLEIEMERLRACDTRACLREVASSTTASAESDSWVRAAVKREVRRGPDGTTWLRVEAEVDGKRQALESLVWVER